MIITDRWWLIEIGWLCACVYVCIHGWLTVASSSSSTSLSLSLSHTHTHTNPFRWCSISCFTHLALISFINLERATMVMGTAVNTVQHSQQQHHQHDRMVYAKQSDSTNSQSRIQPAIQPVLSASRSIGTAMHLLKSEVVHAWHANWRTQILLIMIKQSIYPIGPITWNDPTGQQLTHIDHSVS